MKNALFRTRLDSSLLLVLVGPRPAGKSPEDVPLLMHINCAYGTERMQPNPLEQAKKESTTATMPCIVRSQF